MVNKNLYKTEKGSITLFVLVSMIFFCLILLGFYLSSININNTQLKEIQNIKLGILGIFIASVLGILSPLCMYGTIPIAASFSKKEWKMICFGAFMMSSILLNPQLLIYSVALGTNALLIRLI